MRSRRRRALGKPRGVVASVARWPHAISGLPKHALRFGFAATNKALFDVLMAAKRYHRRLLLGALALNAAV